MSHPPKNPITWMYPNIEPYNSGHLQVSPLHSMYFEECGNPKGIPVVFVHGGPGSGCSANQRRFFHPDRYRIVLFDQTGSGRSTPHAEIQDNDTWKLVQDMETLREHLSIKQWVVFGGSWGSTLSLAYATTHTNKVLGLLLRGIFLLQHRELQWLYQWGTSEIFPDMWEIYKNHIPKEEQHDFISAYHRRLTHTDPSVQIAAAKIWSQWEASTSKLFVDDDMVNSFGEDKFALAFARIESHYFVNKGFFPSDQYLLDNAYKIKHIPTVIVQGRYDLVCPMITAWELSQKLPDAQFIVVPDAGHSVFEPGISRALVAACDEMSFHIRSF